MTELQAKIVEWAAEREGYFTYKELNEHLGIQGETRRQNYIRVIVKRLCDEGLLLRPAPINIEDISYTLPGMFCFNGQLGKPSFGSTRKIRCCYCGGSVPATSWVTAPNIYWCPACQREFEADGVLIAAPVKVKDVKARAQKRKERLPARVRSWVSQQPDKFYSWQIDKALGLTTQREKMLRRVIVARLCTRGQLVRLIPGCFRFVQPAKRIDWQS